MTRKRALSLARAAVVRECPPGKLPPRWPAVERGLELALAHGVVLGMKKAAKTCYDATLKQYPADLIRDDANKLARKLRGAR